MSGINQTSNKSNLQSTFGFEFHSLEGLNNIITKGNENQTETIEFEETPKQTNEESKFSIPKIGDVININDGLTYTASSQGGESGVIGETVRAEGDYTVDAIAILDTEGNLIATYTDNETNIEEELSSLGYTLDDIKNGNLELKYNISEGINENLDRTNAAGWVSFENDNYASKQNVFEKVESKPIDESTRQEALNAINELNESGKENLGIDSPLSNLNNSKEKISDANSTVDQFTVIKNKLNNAEVLTEDERTTLLNMDRTDPAVKQALNLYDMNTNPLKHGQ